MNTRRFSDVAAMSPHPVFLQLKITSITTVKSLWFKPRYSWTWHGPNHNRVCKALICSRQQKFANEFKLGHRERQTRQLSWALFYKQVKEAIDAHEVDGVRNYRQSDRLQVSPQHLLHACVYYNWERCGDGRGSRLKLLSPPAPSAPNRDESPTPRQWHQDSYCLLFWHGSLPKHPPGTAAMHVCQETGGCSPVGKGLCKIKQNGCFSTPEVNSYGQAWSGATRVGC